MFFLVYVISATRPFVGEDLRVLLETCRKNNAELGVTGMLLYKDGNFMQVLEGEDEGSVRGLYGRIAADPRYGGEITLQQGVAEERQSAHDDPRPDQRGRRGRQQPAEQRPPGEIGREGVEHDVDHVSAPAIRSASVRSMPR